MFAHQGNDDVAVAPLGLGIEDLGGCARRVCFGDGPQAELADRAGQLWWAEEPLLGVEEIGLRGPHNRRNAMAAAASASPRGVEPDAVRAGLRTFAGVEHRLEEVATVDGVLYVNDSKATNVDSTLVALAASTTPRAPDPRRPGARARTSRRCARRAAERCAGVYLIGEDGAGDRRRRSARRARAATSTARRRRGARGGAAGRGRAALARLRELRPVRRLRGARPGASRSLVAASTCEAGPDMRPGRRPRRQAQVPRQKPLEYNLLLTATLCLLAAGAVMVYSASCAKTLLQGQGDGTTYLVRYLAYGAIGLVAMQRHLAPRPRAGGRASPGRCWRSRSCCSSRCKLPGFGVTVNGARRWLGAGPLQFQPSELMKLALVLYAAKFLAAAARRRVHRAAGRSRRCCVVAGAAILLVASQPDLGTALVIAFTLSALLVAGGHAGALPGGWSPAAAAFLVVVFAIVEPYRRARLTSFLDPWAHAGDAGFQAVQGQIALGSGGLFGRGLGESVQKIFYLPEAHTDFILAIIGEELGVVGVCALLFLYGMIAYAGLRAAKAARGAYAKLLAAGITSLILCQALLNVFAVLGLAPLTGVPLPFISYGSTNLIVLLARWACCSTSPAGGTVHAARRRQDPAGGGAEDDRDRRRRDSRARGAGAGGRRRAAG